MNNHPNPKKIWKGEIAQKILAAVGLAGIAVLGITAPNIFQLLPGPSKRQYTKSKLDRSVANLKNKGLIKFVQSRTGWKIVLTEKGRAELLTYETRERLLKKAKRWDNKWHLLIFDIAEERKNIREKVRRTLINFGFYRLQDSVWIFPYECEDVLELLRTKYSVRHEALYLRADKLAKDKWLKQHFNLKN